MIFPLHIALRPLDCNFHSDNTLYLTEKYKQNFITRWRPISSIAARDFLIELAYCKNIALPLPRQDAQGVPIFENHLAWSISHTDNFLAVSISQHGSIGIDIERIKPRDIVCFDLFDDTEYQFSGWKDWQTFYRMWTIKESVIKWERSWLDRLQDIHIISSRLCSAEIGAIVFSTMTRIMNRGILLVVLSWEKEGYAYSVTHQSFLSLLY